jgi:hypothetical protein
VLLSAPPWVDRGPLRLIQYRAQCLSELTGIEHHICHIVPLNHPRRVRPDGAVEPRNQARAR